MDDSTYTFVQHQRDVKRLVHSARIQRKGIRPRKVTLPSDSLTAKERRELNGKVMSYDFNRSYQHHELFFWPEDLQREYMQRLIDVFNPPLSQIQKDVLHVSWETAMKYIADLGIVTTTKHQTKDQKEQFQKFLNGELSELKKEKTEEKKPEPKPEPKPSAENSLIIAYAKSVSISTDGLPIPILETVSRFILDPNCEYHITIKAEQIQKGETNERSDEDSERGREDTERSA